MIRGRPEPQINLVWDVVMRIVKYLAGLILLAVIVVGGFFAWAASWPAIEPIDPPESASFDSALVEKGATLAALGDCAVCHTAAGGEPYAGGRPLPTPFGVIHATNITPDPETGIGRWSKDAFRRALRQGVDREGNYLYPAFPYDHFTRLTDDDIAALYAYVMTRAPAAAETPANTLPFPYNVRLAMAGWNLLYLDAGAFAPDPARDEAWNRGAYLVEGIGHCGACHTPRNRFGAEEAGARLAGGDVEGWHATALDASSPAPVPWDEDAMVNYLLDGWDGNHGIAAGPMTPVVDELAAISEDDAYAIAAYVLSHQAGGDAEARAAARAFAEARAFGGSETPAGGPSLPDGADPAFGRGLAVFARVCANCHRANSQPAPLALTSTVNGPDPRNFLHIVVDGIKPPENAFDRSMPGFGGSLSAADLVDLAIFVRAHFSQKPAWGELEAKVQEVRGGE
jgi:mono/diheme cytochrome c family protein